MLEMRAPQPGYRHLPQRMRKPKPPSWRAMLLRPTNGCCPSGLGLWLAGPVHLLLCRCFAAPSIAPDFPLTQDISQKFDSDVLMKVTGCREGFSVLFYGFGSKRRLLEGLAREHFTDGGVVAFNGFVPTLTAREVLTRVATLLRTPRSSAHHAHTSASDRAFSSCSCMFLYAECSPGAEGISDLCHFN